MRKLVLICFSTQKSPGGVISVRFKEIESADACVLVSATLKRDDIPG